MEPLDTAGIILGDHPHYLDHIAPFCALKGYPLLLSEPSIASLAREYYPGLQVLEKSRWEITLPRKIISCHPRPILEATFATTEFRTCWLPHGNSDKGWKSAVFEHLCHEETAFVYGSKMIDLIQEKLGPSHLQIEKVGNFRKAYFEQHKTFYQKLAQQKIGNPLCRKFLYAPTWDDLEGNCSFWQAFPILANNLPDTCALLIKPHPNTIAAFAAQIERCIGQYQHKPNIVWIFDFPLIYPLLDQCDGYIGDMSSIGYDFLSQNRPMYFLNHQKRDQETDQGLYLYRCGTVLMPEQYKNIFNIDPARDREQFSKVREEVYSYTFL